MQQGPRIVFSSQVEIKTRDGIDKSREELKQRTEIHTTRTQKGREPRASMAAKASFFVLLLLQQEMLHPPEAQNNPLSAPPCGGLQFPD